MEIKRSIKTDMVAKECYVDDNGIIIDECGAEIDVAKIARSLYADGAFKLTLTRSTSEEIELDDEE